MTTTRAFTIADFQALPEQQPPLEFSPDGSIQQKLAPTFPHAELQAHLAYLLRRFLDDHPLELGHVVSELRTTVSGASRLPDVGYYRGARPRLGQAQDALLAPRSCSTRRPRSPSTLGPQACGAPTWGTQNLPLGNILPGFHLTPGDVFAILQRP